MGGFQFANCVPADKANVEVTEHGYVRVIKPIKWGDEIVWDYGDAYWRNTPTADNDEPDDAAEPDDAEAFVSDADAETTNGGLALVGCSGASKRKLTAKQKQAIKDAKKKKARTSDHLEAADGGAVPVRRDVVKLNLGAHALVTGCKRTC